MCSIFGPIMDNFQGDLTDILRASGGAYGTTSSSSSATTTTTTYENNWQEQQQQQQLISCDPLNFTNMFGDPYYSTMRDPFLHELPPYFNHSTSSSSAEIINNIPNTGVGEDTSTGFGVELDDHMSTRQVNCKNIFSNMIQISPNSNAKLLPSVSPPPPPRFDSPPAAAMAAAAVSSPRPPIKPPPPAAVISAGNMLSVDNNNTALQISSPRNPAGLKRRKNQAKKVVCIPAPAAANSRQTGEIVPSDLWAWRKYGQKPIKGSPYPRGYYRCSSSKGCSARKQVERSRTDPNMLVITYTSEHNHPWPTQRNALAGSTRSQPSKTNNIKNNNSSETSHLPPQKSTLTNYNKPKEEQQDQCNSDGNVSPVVGGGNNNNSSNSASVKEEEMEDIEKQLEMMDDDGEFSTDDGLTNYKPSIMMDHQGNQSEDFFAELGEIEADPLNLLFSQGFNAGGGGDDHHQRESNKALDPLFHLFDWSGGGDTTNTDTNSFEEPNNKRRL